MDCATLKERLDALWGSNAAVEFPREDAGTTVQISIPDSPMSDKPLRVYLVDDEALALKRLSRLLQETRRVEIVDSTSSPSEAVRFLSDHDVDAVFLDIQMPGMTGFEVLQKLPQATDSDFHNRVRSICTRRIRSKFDRLSAQAYRTRAP